MQAQKQQPGNATQQEPQQGQVSRGIPAWEGAWSVVQEQARRAR